MFTSIGGTRLVAPQGIPGQVTAVSENNTAYGVVTTRENGRVVLESVDTINGGRSWAGPYFSEAASGQVSAPFLALSPAGYPFLAELDNRAGPTQLDQVPFSDAGQPLSAPQPIPPLPSTNGSSPSFASPSVSIDGLGRPLYAWSAPNGTIGYTGAFVSPAGLGVVIRAGFNATVPGDYPSLVGTGLTNFRARVNSTLANISNDLPSSLCAAEIQAYRFLYPNLTTFPTALLAPGPLNRSTCPLRPAPVASPLTAVYGAMEPTEYIGMYGEWMAEALGVGTFPSSNWTGSPLGPPAPIMAGSSTAGTYAMGKTGLNATDSAGDGEFAQVQPITINPDAVWLNATGVIKSRFSMSLIKAYDPSSGTNIICGSTTQSDGPSRVYSNLSYIDSSGQRHTGSYLAGTSYPQVFLTNLSAGRNGTWWENITIIYRQTNQHNLTCIPNYSGNYTQVVSPNIGWPRTTQMHLSGTYTTGLSFSPYPPNGIGGQPNCNPCTDIWTWNNTVVARNNASLSPGYGHNPLQGNYSIAANATFPGIPVSKNTLQTVSITTTTRPGGYNVTWPNQANSGQVNASAYPIPAEVASWTCGFYQLPNMVGIARWPAPAPNATNLSASGATLMWFSNQSGLGWIRYIDANGGTYSADAMRTTVSQGPKPNFIYQYTAVLHGLHAWGFYSALLGVGVRGSCFTYENWTSVTFQTLTVFPLGEHDLPVDSVTKQGGGAILDWQVPFRFVTISQFKNGTLTYWPTNHSTNVTAIQFSTLWATGIAIDGSSNVLISYGLNLSTLTPNWNYSARLTLNFTVQTSRFNASSNITRFWYQKDTSGDGLTDWEKHQGWEVTYQTSSAVWVNRLVTADPDQWATNGLVSDFIEKEFALDPRTVDTAGSHMLDTWNLTFDLGPASGSHAIPGGANFQYWHEESSYDWTLACQAFHDPAQGCPEYGSNLVRYDNISDGSAWAAGVLWSRTALQKFVNLTGVRNASWLRAVLGASGNERTLTVWGKLSWGANPLAASTPGDGYGDGARVDPLYDETLMVTALSASLNSCPNPPTGYSYGWGVQFYLNWSTASGPHELPAAGSWSAEALDHHNGPCGTISSYQVPIPVNGTSQNLSLEVRVELNQSTSSTQTNLIPQRFWNGLTKASISYDTFKGGAPQPYSYSGTDGSLSFTLSMAASGIRAPTFLWLPTDNGTLSKLPWGLKRYTGEQGFDLVVVNSAGSYQSDSVPYAQNASRSYQVSLSQGLNNFLVPRGQFLSSVLGQAVLLGKNASKTNTSVNPPLLGSAENQSMQYGKPDPLYNLACYWQNRALNLSPTGVLCNEAGTAYNTPDSLNVVAATSPSGVNAGGMPGTPSLENSTSSGAAIQSILTLNISGNVQLDLLLAALLDNATGGVNGTFQSIAYEVGLLGLSEPVVDALANTTLSSGGLFGVPWGFIPPTPPPNSSIWNIIVNTCEGIVRTVTAIVSAAWNVTVAVLKFINNHLPTWLKNLGGQFLTRAVGVLQAAGQLIARAWTLLLQAATWLVNQALALVINPIKNAAIQYVTALGTSINATVADVSDGGKNDGTVTTAHALALLGNLGGSIMVLGLTVGIATTVVLAIISGLSLAASFVLGILLTLLVFGALTIFAAAMGFALLTAYGIWVIDNFVNTTISSRNRATLPQVNWRALAESVGAASSGVAVPLSIVLGVYAMQSPAGRLLWAGISMVWDMIAFVCEYIAWAAHTFATAVVGLVAAYIGAIVSYKADTVSEAPKALILLDGVLSVTALFSATTDVIMTMP